MISTDISNVEFLIWELKRTVKPHRHKKEKTYLYFASDGEFVKIGVSNSPTTRLIDLQIGNPRRLCILATYEFQWREEAHELEQYLHFRFRKFRLSGEWFDVLQDQFLKSLIDYSERSVA